MLQGHGSSIPGITGVPGIPGIPGIPSIYTVGPISVAHGAWRRSHCVSTSFLMGELGTLWPTRSAVSVVSPLWPADDRPSLITSLVRMRRPGHDVRDQVQWSPLWVAFEGPAVGTGRRRSQPIRPQTNSCQKARESHALRPKVEGGPECTLPPFNHR